VDVALTGVLSFAAGMAVATLTAPVGISGAVFLLPIQLSLLNVPNPAVTTCCSTSCRFQVRWRAIGDERPCAAP
jgi:hypothetical protein